MFENTQGRMLTEHVQYTVSDTLNMNYTLVFAARVFLSWLVQSWRGTPLLHWPLFKYEKHTGHTHVKHKHVLWITSETSEYCSDFAVIDLPSQCHVMLKRHTLSILYWQLLLIKWSVVVVAVVNYRSFWCKYVFHPSSPLLKKILLPSPNINYNSFSALEFSEGLWCIVSNFYLYKNLWREISSLGTAVTWKY